VEHDREVLQAADHLYDFGPGAGRFGGTIVAHGPPHGLAKDTASLTGQYLCGMAEIPIPVTRRMPSVIRDLPFSREPTASAGGQRKREKEKRRAGENEETFTMRSASRRISESQIPNPELAVSHFPTLSLSHSPTLTRRADAGPPGGGWLELRGARHHNLRD